MRVIVSYLPLDLGGRFIPVSQQRFAKPRQDKESIYPIILASGATLLSQNNFEVKYVDSIMRRYSIDQYKKIVKEYKPEIIIFETKTPIVKNNWAIVNNLKDTFPDIKVVACGDHVTVFPEETLNNSKVDFVITGGDYDVGMLSIAKYLRDKEPLVSGIYYKENGLIKNTGEMYLLKDLDSLPFIDREIVPWYEYHEAWRLYPRFTYIMTGRGCPYKCTFCSWAQMLYKGRYRIRSVENVIEEIKFLLYKYRIQEIFIDTDTFTSPKSWVIKFCNEIINKKIKVVWSCNGHVADVDYEMLRLMKKAGCRMIKFGVESSSQKTIDKINKRYTVEQIKEAFKLCKKAGIHTHATIMIGFYWETKQDMINTIKFAQLLNPYEVQFSIPIAYPGTALYKEAKENGWLRFPEGEWEKYDMSMPTMKNVELSDKEILDLYVGAWKETYFSLKFIINRLLSMRTFRDISLAIRGLKTLINGHIKPAK